VLEIDVRVVGPEALAQLFARNQLARTFEKSSQNLNRLVGNPDPGAALEEFTRTEIERKDSEARLTGSELLHSAAQVYADRRAASTIGCSVFDSRV
jgi:hypothetical protein